jgi:hypothetical protein
MDLFSAMTATAPRLILVLALAALATPALSDTVRRPAKAPAPASDRSRTRQLTPEELAASAGAGPAEVSADAPAQRLATARKAIHQLLGTLPRKPG